MDSTNKIHCTECHQDTERMARHISQCIPQVVACSVCPSPKIKELEEQIRAHGKFNYAEGVFGDYNQNRAYFGDAVMTPKGMQYPIFGCSYLYPNTLLGSVHDSCTSLKRTLMATIRVVFKHWWFFSPLTLIFYKSVFRAFVYWFAEIYESDLKQKTYKYLAEFAPTPREMIRAGLVLASKTYLKELKRTNKVIPFDEVDRYFTHKEFENYDSQAFGVRLKRCIWAIGTFVQSDSAYRVRPQDALSNLDKVKLKENPRKEILRLFDLVLERDNTIKDKVNTLRRLASLLLLFPPALKLAYEYFNELDVSQFQPDEADRYFASKNQGYNFEGKSVEERKKWGDEIDEIKGNVIIKSK